MVTRRRRRRATKQEQATQSQDDSHHMMPTLVKPSPPTNSGIMVLPSLSRDPHLVQAMQQCLSNHSILSRRCHRPKTKGYPRKLHKLLTVKPFQRRKEAGKMSPIDSRSWRKLNPSATGNPYISGRSGHSLKPFERSRGSSRSRHSSSFYPSTWQLEDDSIKKNEQIIDSKNSLEEIIHCACLNRTAYDHRLNTPLKTDTACQCRLKRSREKAIQMPSTRIRSRSSCKLKRLKQLISKHLFSVVAQQTQTSLKSNSHEGKVNGLCNPSLHRCRAYSGEEDNSKNANKKAAKFKNYGGYSPSETSFEDSHERPAEHLSRIEKISKPPRRRPSDPPRIQRENSGRHMDYDIQGPPWSLHLANVKEIERYTARSADWDYCDTVCPKRDICHCDYEDYYDDYDNDEDYNDNNENYNDYDNDGNKDEDGPAEEDGNPDGDGDADVIVENSEKNTDRQDRRQEVLSHDDDKSITTHEDFDDPEDAKVMEEKASVNEDSLVEIDDKKDEKKDSSDQRDSSKTKKWKNVGFCPDVTCNRKCGHCSKVQMETECDCENSVRGRNGEPPRYTNRGICKCCQCSRTPSFNRLNSKRK
ncbi:uncharacterized protein [Drosophila tropicalis]|uniref:uncharacterized protein n=1 Tax=Drosophila tropicalis TaxID=46794 RepID=UPI0035ABEF4D